MVEVPGVGAIVEQIKARIGQIEEQLRQQGTLTDELERLRDALGRLDGDVSARRRGTRTTSKAPPRKPTAPANKPAAAKTPSAATKSAAKQSAAANKPATARKRAAGKGAAAGKPRRARSAAPRGEVRAKIIDALKDGAKTAGEIAAATGVNRGTASTTLTNLAKAGVVVKAERGYKLPEAA